MTATAAVRAGRGRPLRFLAMVTTGWVGLRVVLLWPQDSAAAPVAAAAFATPPPPSVSSPSFPPPLHQAVAPVSPRWRPAAAATAALPHRPTDRARVALALPGLVRYGDWRTEPDQAVLPGLPHASAWAGRVGQSAAPSRWSASAWLVARGGSGIAPGVVGGQLGGSQAGVRVAYQLDRRHRVALAGRIATPLGSGLREASAGFEWQPSELPVRLVAERRFALDGGRGGPALGMVGGFGPVGIPHGLRIEGYGQAGLIRRAANEAYADAAVRVARTLAMLGPARVELGAGAWGAAQRGAARLDFGPSLGIVTPLAGQKVRLSLDWRQRVAGDAHPGSGPALTLGTDF